MRFQSVIIYMYNYLPLCLEKRESARRIKHEKMELEENFRNRGEYGVGAVAHVRVGVF